jgi:hypothetical protein
MIATSPSPYQNVGSRVAQRWPGARLPHRGNCSQPVGHPQRHSSVNRPLLLVPAKLLATAWGTAARYPGFGESARQKGGRDAAARGDDGSTMGTAPSGLDAESAGINKLTAALGQIGS